MLPNHPFCPLLRAFQPFVKGYFFTVISTGNQQQIVSADMLLSSRIGIHTFVLVVFHYISTFQTMVGFIVNACFVIASWGLGRIVVPTPISGLGTTACLGFGQECKRRLIRMRAVPMRLDPNTARFERSLKRGKQE